MLSGREAHEMGSERIIPAEAHSVLLISLLGVLRDTPIVPPESIRTAFLGAAAILDRVAPN
jgi:hypothetical protein